MCFQIFLIGWAGHWQIDSWFFGSGNTGVTSANFINDGKIVEFSDIFINVNKKGENNLTFSFKIFEGMSVWYMRCFADG